MSIRVAKTSVRDEIVKTKSAFEEHVESGWKSLMDKYENEDNMACLIRLQDIGVNFGFNDTDKLLKSELRLKELEWLIKDGVYLADKDCEELGLLNELVLHVFQEKYVNDMRETVLDLLQSLMTEWYDLREDIADEKGDKFKALMEKKLIGAGYLSDKEHRELHSWLLQAGTMMTELSDFYIAIKTPRIHC